MGRICHEGIHEGIQDFVMTSSRVWEIFEIEFVSDVQVQSFAPSRNEHDNQARS